MAYVSTASHDAFHGSAPAKTGEKPGFFRRLLVAIEQAKMLEPRLAKAGALFCLFRFLAL